MPIPVTCACGKQYKLKDEFAGRRAKCPACGGIIVVPDQRAGEQTPTPPPVPAPVATEVPHPPFLTAEARSTTTWKCPTCAEEIQKEAQKCRFCGMILTKAAKMGYPAFYESVAKGGLSFTSLLFDYGDFLYPDEEGVNDCCLGAPDMLGSLFDNRDEDQKEKVLRIAGGIVKAMRERLSDIPAESQEALTIKAGSKFLWMVRDFARPGDPIHDPHTLQFAISHFTELRQTLSHIGPDGRGDLEQHIDYAIQACQSQLGTTGRACSESLSPATSDLQSQDAPSGAGRDLSALPKELTLDLGSSSGLSAITGSRVKLELVLIPAGKFMMGSPLHEEGRTELECPPLDVTISQPYYMGKYPVTQEQYEKIIGRNFSDMKGTRNPAERVSWNDASEFCRKLSALTGKMVRLPTNAEWEYACRAGTTTRFYSGDSESDLKRVGWYADNSGQRTHPVGKKVPNAWGLYDMHGNVYEWCRDWSDNPSERSGPIVDPQGPEYGSVHPLRGGCWGSSANDCRSAAGMECAPEPRNNSVGFRVVVDPWHRELITQKRLESENTDEQELTENAPSSLPGLRQEELPRGGGGRQQPVSQAIPSDFSFLRDFKRIQWGATLWLNLMRAMASGIVLCVVLLIAFRNKGSPQSWQIPLCMLAMPLGYLLFLAPLGLLAGALAKRGLRWLGLITFFCVLDILPGDPVVFILHKVCPRLVPVQQFGFMNFSLVIWVLADTA